jgi:hypothetical protein
MFRKFDQDLQPLVAGQFLIEVAIRFFCLCEVGKALDRFFHAKS